MDLTHLVAGLLLLALALSLRNYARQRVEGRAPMALARSLALGVLVWVLLSPAWVRPDVERQRPRLTVLVDTSESMALPLEGAAGASRFEAASAAYQALLDHYQGAFDVDLRTFASELGDGPLPAEPGAVGTDLGGALAEALRSADPRTRALFLVSDGRRTRGGDATRVARASGFPVHTLSAGAARRAPTDVAVLGVEVPEEGFAGGAVQLRARLRVAGVSGGTRIPVLLEVDGQEAARAEVVVDEASPEAEVQLEFTPASGGLKGLRVVASPPDAELDTSPKDDAAESSLRVHEEPVPVLLLSGRPSPDLGFLRRLLDADPRFVVTQRAGYPPDRAVDLPAPDQRASLERAPLVVVSGFSEEAFPPAVQQQLVAYLRERGGALLLIGNGLREWQALLASQLKDLLPVTSKTEAAAIEKRLPAHPTGRDHSLTQLIDHKQANDQAWQRLPPIAPGLRLELVRGARSFLQFPYYPRPVPLVAAREVGRGVVLAVNSRETYLWAMLPFAHGDAERVHARFFTGLAAWAADPSRAGGERLRLGRLRYRPGDEVLIDWSGKPGDEKRREALVVPVGGGAPRSVKLEAKTPGRAQGRFEAAAPGVYEVRPSSGEAAPQYLAVHRSREEDLAPDPDPEHLKAIAEATGGATVALTAEGLDPAKLPPVDATPVIRRRDAETFWLDEGWVLGLALGLLCLEWYLRRRRNLV